MTKTGSLKEARQLAGLITSDEWGYNTVPRDLLPEGWKLLGMGGWRTAFLSPSGVVYKVDRTGNSNKKEARRYRSVGRRVGRGFRFAPCTYYRSAKGILAMEYVKDDGSDAWDSHKLLTRYMETLGYRDCHEFKRKDNWHGVKGIAIITDYAYGYDE